METLSSFSILKEEEQKRELWFEEFINSIKVHKLQLDTKTASKEIDNLYRAAIDGNLDRIALLNNEAINQYFTTKIIIDFIDLLNDNLPIKLAFDYKGSEILVWAEIPDNDSEFEKKLILSEAKVNAKYHDYGFDITSTIVEASDNFNVPIHYKVVK